MSGQWTEETAKKAAEWWWQKIQKGIFDNGSEDGFATMMATVLHDGIKPANDKREIFVSTLVSLVCSVQPLDLSCDYDPDQLLYESCQKAGIDEKTLPWKSITRISLDGQVYAKCGYGKPDQVI